MSHIYSNYYWKTNHCDLRRRIVHATPNSYETDTKLRLNYIQNYHKNKSV